jgi:phosphatidylserine decarboxylase
MSLQYYGIITISVVIVLAFFFLLWFNRDPKRQPPLREGIIVSPADGRILYIKQFEAGDLPVSRKFSLDIRLEEVKHLQDFLEGSILIGIYLSPFDVHVTRAPITGRVVLAKHTMEQLFLRSVLALKTADERAVCAIQRDDGLTVAVAQMAAYLVRRVILSVQDNEYVEIGQRIGKIRLGSQVDLVLPRRSDVCVIVRPGEKVTAGETIIATFSHA